MSSQFHVLEKQRAQIQEFEQHIIDSLDEMVLLLDESGDVIFANAAVERVLGYAPQDVMGSAWWELVIPDAAQRREMRAQAAARARGEQTATNYDLELPRRDKSKIWTSWTENRGLNGELICIGRNVTERQQTRDELERQVEERTTKLAQANSALREEIAERKLAEVVLRRREKQLTEAQRIAHLGDWEWDIVQNTVIGSDELYRLFGIPSERFGQNLLEEFLDCIYPEDHEHVDGAVEQSIDAHIPFNIEYRIVRTDGTMRNIHSRGEVVYNKAGRPTTILGTSQDITERVQAEKALWTSEKRYRQLVQALQEGIWAIDKDACTTFVNPRMAEMLGYTEDEMQGKHLFEFMDEHGVEIAKHQLERRRQGIQEQHDFEFLRQDGTRIYASLETTSLTDNDENYAGALAGVMDITARKRAEEQIAASLREKEVLLTEIHHRVNNNLQVVSSLLNFQADYAQDEHAIKVLRNSQHRVYSMALIHEQLYQAPNLAQVDVANYVQNLTTDLFSAYRAHSAHPITLRLDVHDVSLEIKQAIPFGLLVNELVSNALKHAFPADLDKSETMCEIFVSLSPVDGETGELVVSDNGIGLAPDFGPSGKDSLGMFLIDTFVQQLEGTIEWQNQNGTTCRIVFALQKRSH
ncbi:MAG: PAS domain S-box protein [Chloroflexi bacterium]|nr:PAS domain S-box protein [Chloroflexota bacterium]